MTTIILSTLFLVFALASHAMSQLTTETYKYPNGDILIKCLVNGMTLEPVEWYFNSTKLAGGNDQSRIQVLTNNTLILRDLTQAQYGAYVCNYTFAGKTVLTTRQISGSPLKIMQHSLGPGVLLLTCLVNDAKSIPVGWSFQRAGSMTSITLRGGDDDDDVQVLPNNTLIVRDFGEEDEGRYSCNATVMGSRTTATANVGLHNDMTDPQRATIDTYTNPNSDIFLTCKVGDNPADRVTWSVDHDNDDDIDEFEIVPAGNETTHVQILGNSTLLIRESDQDDVGSVYQCLASLPDGMQKRARAVVSGCPPLVLHTLLFTLSLAFCIHTLWP